MTSLQKANKAHEIHKELSNLRVSALWHFYRMGELVREVRDEQYWEVLGYDSFESYLSDPDIAIPVSSAYHAIGVVETFPRYKEIEGLTVRNTITILSAVRQKESKRERLVEMARTLSISDLRHELLNRRLLEQKIGNQTELPKIYSCKDCGGVKGISWQNLCHCGLRPEAAKEIAGFIEKKYDN